MSSTEMLVVDVLVILALGGLFCLWIALGNRRGTAVLLGAAYLYTLIALTILRQTPYPVHRAILEPFHSYRIVLRGLLSDGRGVGLLFEMAANVLVFLPLGLMLSRLLRAWRWAWAALLLGLLTSLTIELAQYFTYLGIFELDDLFHNTLGTLLGFWLGRCLCALRERQDEEGIRYVLGALP